MMVSSERLGLGLLAVSVTRRERMARWNLRRKRQATSFHPLLTAAMQLMTRSSSWNQRRIARDSTRVSRTVLSLRSTDW